MVRDALADGIDRMGDGRRTRLHNHILATRTACCRCCCGRWRWSGLFRWTPRLASRINKYTTFDGATAKAIHVRFACGASRAAINVVAQVYVVVMPQKIELRANTVVGPSLTTADKWLRERNEMVTCIFLVLAIFLLRRPVLLEHVGDVARSALWQRLGLCHNRRKGSIR